MPDVSQSVYDAVTANRDANQSAVDNAVAQQEAGATAEAEARARVAEWDAIRDTLTVA